METRYLIYCYAKPTKEHTFFSLQKIVYLDFIEYVRGSISEQKFFDSFQSGFSNPDCSVRFIDVRVEDLRRQLMPLSPVRFFQLLNGGPESKLKVLNNLQRASRFQV